jgi:hypothetical protein
MAELLGVVALVMVGSVLVEHLLSQRKMRPEPDAAAER